MYTFTRYPFSDWMTVDALTLTGCLHVRCWCCRKKQKGGQADSNYQSYNDVSSIASYSSSRRTSSTSEARPITNPELCRQLRLTNSSSTRVKPHVSPSFQSVSVYIWLYITLKLAALFFFLSDATCEYNGISNGVSNKEFLFQLFYLF